MARNMAKFVINTPQKLKDKLDMVQALGDIEIATRLLEETGKSGLSEVDSNYEKLHCKIVPLAKNVSVLRITQRRAKISRSSRSTHIILTLLHTIHSRSTFRRYSRSTERMKINDTRKKSATT